MNKQSRTESKWKSSQSNAQNDSLAVLKALREDKEAAKVWKGGVHRLYVPPTVPDAEASAVFRSGITPRPAHQMSASTAHRSLKTFRTEAGRQLRGVGAVKLIVYKDGQPVGSMVL